MEPEVSSLIRSTKTLLNGIIIDKTIAKNNHDKILSFLKISISNKFLALSASSRKYSELRITSHGLRFDESSLRLIVLFLRSLYKITMEDTHKAIKSIITGKIMAVSNVAEPLSPI